MREASAALDLRERAELADVPRDEALAALEQAATVLFGYQVHVASRVAESCAVADDALSRSRAHVRQGLEIGPGREDVFATGLVERSTTDHLP